MEEPSHRVIIALSESQCGAVQEALERKYGDRVQVETRSTFSALVENLGRDVHGIILGSSLENLSTMNPPTYLKVLQAVAEQAIICLLLTPEAARDLSEIEPFKRVISVVGQRREGESGHSVAYDASCLITLVHRMDERALVPALSFTETPPVQPVLADPSDPEPELLDEVPIELEPAQDLEGAPTAPANTVAPATPGRLARVIAFVSPTTGVGKTAASVNVATFAGRLGISTLLIDQTVLPPGNAALRLGFTLQQPGMELLLQGPWDDDTWSRIKARYGDTSLTLLRPISDNVIGTLTQARDQAYEGILEHAKAEYSLVVIDTSPVLDDISVVTALQKADRVVIVVETTDDRVQQALAKAPIIDALVPRDKLIYVVNKVGPGGWSPEDIVDALDSDHKVKWFALPNDPVRHAKAAKQYRPLAMDAGPFDPWAKLFLYLAGDLIPAARRKRWAVPAGGFASVSKSKSVMASAPASPGPFAHMLAWLAGGHR